MAIPGDAALDTKRIALPSHTLLRIAIPRAFQPALYWAL